MREVWLFTMRYPFGLGEAFLENELPVLCRHHARVTIVPQFAEGTPRSVPANARVITMPEAAFGRATPAELLRFGRRAWGLWRSLREDGPPPGELHRQRGLLRSRLLQAVHRAAALERLLKQEQAIGRVRLYAYWSHDWAIALALLRAGDPRVRFISRAHGFDLYRHQHASGWIPFQAYIMRHVERIWAVSTAGLDYLRTTYPSKAHLFGLSMLGTTDHGENPWVPPFPLRITTCSYIIPRKRLLGWVEVLRHVSVPVEWTHFGDGPERAALEARIAGFPPHIRVELKGHRSNAEVMAWYRTNPVHLFVLFSPLEGGVAVAAQEAASFGIPLLVTDSGGVRDLVNDHTGRLLPRDPDPVEVANWIDRLADGPWCTPAGRAGVRAFWKSHFHAEAAFARFCSEALDPLG